MHEKKVFHIISSVFCSGIRPVMNFNQSDTGASCRPHHSLLALSNKSTLIIARSVYIGWKSAGQGPLSLFFFLVKCVYVEPIPHRRCAGSAAHSASQNLLPWACRPPAAEPGSRRSEGIIRESVCVCLCVCALAYFSISFI